jgi:hypothetical protein
MTPNCGYGVGGKDTPDTVTEGTEQHSNTSWGTEYRSRAGENLESNVREKKKKARLLEGKRLHHHDSVSGVYVGVVRSCTDVRGWI